MYFHTGKLDKHGTWAYEYTSWTVQLNKPGIQKLKLVLSISMKMKGANFVNYKCLLSIFGWNKIQCFEDESKVFSFSAHLISTGLAHLNTITYLSTHIDICKKLFFNISYEELAFHHIHYKCHGGYSEDILN